MYIVEAYAADGCYVNPDRKEFDTLEEAREYIREEIGGDFGQWSEDCDTAPEGFLPIEAWHESEKEGCGGYGIYAPVVVRVCDAHLEGGKWIATPGQDWPEYPETLEEISDWVLTSGEDAAFVWLATDETRPVLVKAAVLA